MNMVMNDAMRTNIGWNVTPVLKGSVMILNLELKSVHLVQYHQVMMEPGHMKDAVK